MRYSVDSESFQEDIRSNKNILDITTKNPASNKNLSIKDDNKEKLKFAEDDVKSVEDWYYINDTLTREQSEERINISLMFLTPLSLKVLPCYWALLTLLLFFGPFRSEGKKFQQGTGETPRWLPLSADPTPGAEEASELTNAREDHLTPGFVDQKQKTKKTGYKDFVQQKTDQKFVQFKKHDSTS